MNSKDAERLAKERAHINAKRKVGVGTKAKKSQPNPALTSYNDLIGEYRTATAYLSSGYAFDIQTLTPGDLVIIVGTPLIKLLTDRGHTINENTTISDLNGMIGEMPEDEQIDLYESDDFTDIMSNTICRSVISVNFVNKKQFDCNPVRKEVSVIDRLSELDRFELFTQIMALTGTESDINDADSFQEPIKESDNGIGNNTNT